MMNGGYIALIVCLVLTTAARKDGIYEIGKAHCPCTRFCSDDIETVYTNGTEELILTGSSSDEGKADVCSGNDIFQPQEKGININYSRVARKLAFGDSDQVRHKPGCTTTEGGYRA